MSTAHEYDIHGDTCAAIEPTNEKTEHYREDVLRRQGAKEALKDLQSYLLHCGCHPELKAEVNGIIWSLNAIKRRLDDLELTPEVGGDFPDGYFSEGGVA